MLETVSLTTNLLVRDKPNQGREGLAYTIDDALDEASIDVIDRNDEWGVYSFKLKGIDTEIVVKLCRSPISENTRFERSHDIKTPEQADPYHSSHLFWDYPAYALHQAVTGITMHYEQAVKAGHKPAKSWLVPNVFKPV